MQILPPALNELIDALSSLPGVGPRTAERYAYHLLKQGTDSTGKLAAAMQNLHDNVGYCEKTFVLVENGQRFSPLYTNPERDKNVVAVVADPFDVIALEKTNNYKGTYHVLGGLVSPIDNIGPEQLRITELLSRIKEDSVTELIFALNASVEGESTALYIQQQLGPSKKLKITRLAQGLPIGVDLEYADQITLSRALEGRTAL